MGYPTTMIKNSIVILFLTAIIGGGIVYAIYSDPELSSLQLFERAMVEFARNADGLEAQFRKNQSMTDSTKELSLAGNRPQSNSKPLVLSMVVSKRFVTLVFSIGDWPLANQSIVLEPFLPEISTKDGRVRWKCLGGSVLVRFRSKNCRLGYGVLISELK